ncbi:methionyl aminopeptidase [Saprolegnia diclina VS20]|uniref:Methionine aminopeptidase n=1 Tax=Saprolegnia diclina (strain VS20) TaxID=1156394 RepID=T0SBV9_SAPDV|nr:methionyl aminopeptidase [Saprolegnia diclina VS20]EQC40262.1 methionyl aminopeptidase [Saprolegnia diclina VS20]|eukprot:XP_008605961.1 methionyl aminopeptidase [Saprolegnia diclina VS20]
MSDVSNSVCASPGCGKPAKMACPTCKKLGVPANISSFCSQECFKSYWPQHKGFHKIFTQSQTTDKFFGYQFTGDIRPGTVTPMKTVPDHIQKPDYAVSGIPVSEQAADRSNKIPVYSADEIAGIREACRIGREVLDIAGRSIRIGMTTNEIDEIVHAACMEREVYPSPLNYYHFPKSVCTSVNEVICHGIPDSRPLQDGDILNIDVTVYKNGYHGDLNDTFLVGNVDEEGVRLVKNSFDCLAAAVAMVKPGTMYRDLGKAIALVAEAEGFSVVKTYCGHGIGSLFHTAPNVPHYAKNKAVGIMRPGHIFTIEPMINVGSWRDGRWPDDWTAVTTDGKRSAQFEHTILVTETGYELLTARQDEPVMTWDLAKVQRGL